MAWTPIDLNVPQYVDANGDPYSGAVLKAYAAGTTTNISLATDNTGGTTVSSVALNASGFPEVSASVVIPHVEQDFKLALYPDQASADADSGALWTVDNIGLGQVTTEWVDSGVTPTFVSTTSFTVAGDQTTEFHVGRRLRLTDSGGTDYASITASAFSTLTTVTVSVDGGGVLDSGLSAVDLSILSADNSAMPHLSSSATGLTATGALTMDADLKLKQGADVASAAALPVDVDGNAFDVTGTATITSLNSKGIGTHITLQFDGALTLTHHATDLILPGGANITTAAGDIAGFYEYATGDWRCLSYSRADGMAVVPADIVLSSPVATTSGTSVTLTSAVPANARQVDLLFDGVSTSGTSNIIVQIGDSGGFHTSGYVGSAGVLQHAGSITISPTTAGFGVFVSSATDAYTGLLSLRLADASDHKWMGTGSFTTLDATDAHATTDGIVNLDTALTQIRITTVGGSDTFDAGAVSVSWQVGT